MTGQFHSARDLGAPLVLETDTVVIGSGASGAVVATELALAGKRVLVLEEGPRVSAEAHGRMRPSQSLRHVWRDGGMSIAIGVGDSPSINVTTGRCVGGSSFVTGGVCFRIPDLVLDTWVQEHGLREYGSNSMRPFFERVEKAIHVETVPLAMQSRSTRLFGDGARRCGFELKPMRRNTRGCDGCGQCNFGCPNQAKLSVDLSYLPRAIEAGAEVWSHCRVDRIITKGSQAIGVEGRLLNRPGGKPGERLRVHAKRIVIAAGAWLTPLILKRSGIGRRTRLVGKNLTLHPAFRMMARFDSKVRGWQGALQSAYSDHFEHEGITLTSVFVPVGVLAATMPGIGVDHVRRARQIDHLAMFGGILHDEGGGMVHRGIGREPFVTYRMAKRDRARIPQILRTMAEAFLAAGAREVYPPILGLEGGLCADAFRRLDLEGIPARRFECSSQHPLGSARMGVDPANSVVDPNGRCWDLDNVYVVDGSTLPTSLGVNPQLAIMSIATRMAARMID